MKKIYLLKDYRNRFESKHKETPYRSGFDQALLIKYFNERGFNAKILSFNEMVNKTDPDPSVPVIYTSAEDPGFLYKSYIEDVILWLEERGHMVIPSYKFLRATNNKVFMELLLKTEAKNSVKLLNSYTFGVLEEFLEIADEIDYPCVIKGAEGAISTNVHLGKNKADAIKAIKDINGGIRLKEWLKEWVRVKKHIGYVPESLNRKKFIVQEYVEGLQNDWKIYFFGEKLYIWYRKTRDNDFRASGSGKFAFNTDVPIPEGLLDFAASIYKALDVPFISMDMGYDGNTFALFETQYLFFGKNGHYYSDFYYENENGKWIKKENHDDIEKVYVDAIVKFLNDGLTTGVD